ncbi:uncharacterized protein BT62DRAFT_600809 [Guyanagaster necrorhizus]|uniref:Uncharacterized protein n=1 Tax=Guyanagaster necrorhizus TaxID=856835 RepID=A0A9P7W1J2_9AGAR|nr:uncharacterized protein BT62DRAFT_600809 [Guyanagaster necrorhizus MCA 3950]KAG7449681.1 hypothetical protein BT62DRAFT_600809 [Guyanagaster necrorhizus MCA 3950]
MFSYVDLTVKAYDDLLVVKGLVGDDKNLMDPLFRPMIRAADLAGTIDLASDVSDSNKIVGTTVWFGPRKSLFAEQRRTKKIRPERPYGQALPRSS